MQRTLIAALVLGAQGVAAQTRDVQYLAYRGGTRALLVDQAEARFSQAFWRDDDRFGVYVGCFAWTETDGTRLLRTTFDLSLAGRPDFGGIVDLVGIYPDGTATDLGPFYYTTGAYRGNLSPAVLARMLRETEPTLRATNVEFVRTVPLDGLVIAVEGIECDQDGQY